MESYDVLHDYDRFSDEVQQLLIRGVSARDFSELTEKLDEDLPLSKSSANRAFQLASQRDLDEINGRDLSGDTYCCIKIEGIEQVRSKVIVALGLTTQGCKKTLGPREGATENRKVVKDLIQSLVDRGLFGRRTSWRCWMGPRLCTSRPGRSGVIACSCSGARSTRFATRERVFRAGYKPRLSGGCTKRSSDESEATKQVHFLLAVLDNVESGQATAHMNRTPPTNSEDRDVFDFGRGPTYAAIRPDRLLAVDVKFLSALTCLRAIESGAVNERAR